MTTNTATPLMQDLRDARQLLQDLREWQGNDELLTFERQVVLVDQIVRTLDTLLPRFDPPTPAPGDDSETMWLVSVLAELGKQRAIGLRQAGHVAAFAVEQWRLGYHHSATLEFVTAFRLARATLAFEEALALLTASTATFEVAVAADDEEDPAPPESVEPPKCPACFASAPCAATLCEHPAAPPMSQRLTRLDA